MHETRAIFKDGREIVTRLSRFGERPEREFDIQFWQGRTSAERFTAAWQMVVERWQMQGKDPDELRLQRSVTCVQRRGR